MAKRPSLFLVDKELDEDQVKRAILAHDGNLTVVAQKLGVVSERLRLFVSAKPNLKAAMAEVMERGVDLAVAVLFEGLRDQESFQNRFYAAKQFLQSEAARKRGFGREPTIVVDPQKPGQIPVSDRPATIEIRWIDPPQEAPKDEEPKKLQ